MRVVLVASAVSCAFAGCFSSVAEGQCAPAVQTVPFVDDAGRPLLDDYGVDMWGQSSLGQYATVGAFYDTGGRLFVDGMAAAIESDGGWDLPAQRPAGFRWTPGGGRVRKSFSRYVQRGDGGSASESGYQVFPEQKGGMLTDEVVLAVEFDRGTTDPWVWVRRPVADPEHRVRYSGRGELIGWADGGVAYVDWLPTGLQATVPYGGSARVVRAGLTGGAHILVAADPVPRTDAGASERDSTNRVDRSEHSVLAISEDFTQVRLSESIPARSCQALLGALGFQSVCTVADGAVAQVAILDSEFHRIEDWGAVALGSEVLSARSIDGHTELVISVPDSPTRATGQIVVIRDRITVAKRDSVGLPAAASYDPKGYLVLVSPRRTEAALAIERWCIP